MFYVYTAIYFILACILSFVYFSNNEGKTVFFTWLGKMTTVFVYMLLIAPDYTLGNITMLGIFFVVLSPTFIGILVSHLTKQLKI